MKTETLATPDTQDTERRQKTNNTKTKTMNNTDPTKSRRVFPGAR